MYVNLKKKQISNGIKITQCYNVRKFKHIPILKITAWVKNTAKNFWMNELFELLTSQSCLRVPYGMFHF